MRLSAIDLFSGCGGLTLGLRRSGFQIKLAIEKDPIAASTFSINHTDTEVVPEDIRDVTVERILSSLGGAKLDLLAGCAPCQGFCSLTAKYAREDPRNTLMLEMLRIITGTLPKVVLMENVPGITTRGKDILSAFKETLRDSGYQITDDIVQMADYGVPQFRRRYVLIASQVGTIDIPKATHSRLPSVDHDLLPWVTIGKVLNDEKAPLTMKEAFARGGPIAQNWHVVRTLEPQTIRRLNTAIPGKTWLCIPEDVRPVCHRDGYKGFTNTYGRMASENVSPTITAGFTTPCKGRFGHPDMQRTTISVREGATLQTFPPDYYFDTSSMEEACHMIGNAVPPLFAEIVGRSIAEAIRG